MSQTNSEWDQRRAVQKGKLGEQILDALLREKGYVPYRPVIEGPHPVDRFYISRDRRPLGIADAKAKPSRDLYQDTGINVRHYKEYQRIQDQHNIPIFLFFVDEWMEQIYGGNLDDISRPWSYRDGDHQCEIENDARRLRQQYPSEEASGQGILIIYFPLLLMSPIADLTPAEISLLSGLRDSDYYQLARQERAGQKSLPGMPNPRRPHMSTIPGTPEPFTE